MTKFVFALTIFISSVSFLSRAGAWAPPSIAPGLKETFFTQQIDHSGRVPGTFQQRYWIDTEFASGPDAPVLLRIDGEDNGESFIPDMSLTYAKTLHAYVIYIEHRYYGQSQPFADLSNAHLEFLTLENTIEDLAVFETSLKQSMGLTGKWISLGGSYSGTLSAIFRLQHPELVVGALAASAPMIEKDFALDDGSDTGDYASTKISDFPGGGRQWAYEACTRFNFWYSESAKAGATIRQPNAKFCEDDFGVNQRSDIDDYNRRYRDPFVNAPVAGAVSASNILFSNGTADAWSQIVIHEAENGNPGITILTIPGAGHHFDMNAPKPDDSADVLQARVLFLRLMKQWLGL